MGRHVEGRTLEWTPQALDVLDNMGARLYRIGSVFSEHSEEYAKACETFATSMLTLARMGGKVMSDGELSLIVDTQVGIVMGVNWSSRKVTRDGYASFGDELQVAGSWSCNS